MAYPAFKILEESVIIPRTGVQLDNDGDGLTRGRKLHPTRYDFRLVHNFTAADETTFLDYFSANENSTFDVVWRGTTYSVRFGEPPYTFSTLKGAYVMRYDVNLVAA